ncbi:MAG: superoxide dismutase, partial [Reyranella sp.]|nr:superoxide dismutase [Reyranella sp.]
MTIVQNRRAFIGAAAGVALAATAADAFAQAAPKVEYAIKKLPFDPAKIKGLSEKLLVSHYENNYSGAVKRLNAITAQLAGLDMASAPVFVVNGLKREELIAANSMIIHELYFDGLGGEGEPAGALAEAITRDFGSVARWKTEFAAMGRALGGGSGWVLLT